MERITGPTAGIYVAAYTTELQGVFYGYAKLCLVRPEDVWSAHSDMKITSRAYTDETLALEAVEARALRLILEASQHHEGSSFLTTLMSRFTS